MEYLFDTLRHIQAVRQWAQRVEAQAIVDISTLQLTIGLRNRSRLHLHPRFMIKTSAGPAYTTTFTSACRFVGWPPYEIKRWPAGTGKTAFKEYCARHMLRTPQVWNKNSDPSHGYIIKPTKGSWGQGIRGPYAHHVIPEQLAEMSSDSVVEQFIVGRPVKIWYWNAMPAAIHVASPPTIYGDGLRTLREILGQPRGSFDRSFNIALREEFIQWQGINPDDILPAGHEVILDILLVTPFDHIDFTDKNHLASQPESVRNQLVAIGESMVDAIPSSIRKNTFYTVDAIIDESDQLWLLEMNCHPVFHPAIYNYMLSDLAFK